MGVAASESTQREDRFKFNRVRRLDLGVQHTLVRRPSVAAEMAVRRARKMSSEELPPF